MLRSTSSFFIFAIQSRYRDINTSKTRPLTTVNSKISHRNGLHKIMQCTSDHTTSLNFKNSEVPPKTANSTPLWPTTHNMLHGCSIKLEITLTCLTLNANPNNHITLSTPEIYTLINWALINSNKFVRCYYQLEYLFKQPA